MTSGSGWASGAAWSADEAATPPGWLAGAGTRRDVLTTYGGGVARQPTDGKPAQIREHRLAVLVDGTPCPICSSPVFRHHLLDLYRTDAIGTVR